MTSTLGAARRRRQARLPATISWPSDYGHIDITASPYSADPTGVADATQAIRDALADAGRPTNFSPQMVYLPAGTYKVSDHILTGIDTVPVPGTDTGISATRLCGAGKTKTIIRLADSSSGYGSAGTQKNVIELGSNSSEKNAAFGNYVQHLTIEIGAGNPGAIALQGSMANSGCISHVRLIGTASGRVGFAFYGSAGPGYIRDLTIDGFDWAINGDSTNVNNYVFEDVTINAPRLIAIRSVGRVVSFLDLKVADAPLVVSSTGAQGVVTIVRGAFTGGAGGPAINMTVKGMLYLRDVTCTGYSQIVTLVSTNFFVGASSIKEWSSEDYWIGATKTAWTEAEATYKSLNLPIKKAPEWHVNAVSRWADVQDFGATPGASNSATAFQSAIDGGAEVIYFPYSTSGYTLDSNVIVRANVRKVDFNFNRVLGTAIISVASSRTVLIENVHAIATIDFRHDGAGRTVLRNGGEDTTIDCGASAAGDLYIENIGPRGQVYVGSGVRCWARQLNRENALSSNNAGDLWLYGENVEGMYITASSTTVMRPITTSNGGRTEIFGGAEDPTSRVHDVSTGPAYDVVNGAMSLIGTGRMDLSPKGTFPWVIRDTLASNVINLYDQTLGPPTYVIEESTTRQVWPLYRSQSMSVFRLRFRQPPRRLAAPTKAAALAETGASTENASAAFAVTALAGSQGSTSAAASAGHTSAASAAARRTAVPPRALRLSLRGWLAARLLPAPRRVPGPSL